MRWHQGTVTRWAQSASGTPRRRPTRSLPWMPASASGVRLAPAGAVCEDARCTMLAGWDVRRVCGITPCLDVSY
jgi:hypothetical protein